MDFVYSQSPWVLPKDPEGTEKIFSDHGWKVTFNDHEVIPFGLEKRVYFIGELSLQVQSLRKE